MKILTSDLGKKPPSHNNNSTMQASRSHSHRIRTGSPGQTLTAPRTPTTNMFFKKRQNIAVKAQLDILSGQTPITKRLFGRSMDGLFEEGSRTGSGENIFANHGHLQNLLNRKRGNTNSGILDFHKVFISNFENGNRGNMTNRTPETGKF
jgi:hypothetical protein